MEGTTIALPTQTLTPTRKRKIWPKYFDTLFRTSTTLIAWSGIVLSCLGLLYVLAPSALVTFERFGSRFVVDTEWDPVAEIFGAALPIYGTIMTSMIAVLLATPLAFGIALFLTQVCPRSLRKSIAALIGLLAAVPSIAYGMWGKFVLVPTMHEYVFEPLATLCENVPILQNIFTGSGISGNIFYAGIVLAIMILPFITAIFKDLCAEASDPDKNLNVPAMYSLGTTMWEVMWYLVVPTTKSGLVGAIILGLGRALGETMAVTFVIGSVYRFGSVFDPGISIAAAIALNFGEAPDGSMMRGSLLTLAFILCLISVGSTIAAQWLLRPKTNAGSSFRYSTKESRLTKEQLVRKRMRRNTLAIVLSWMSATVVLAILGALFFYLAIRGINGMSFESLEKLKPAMVGNLIMVSLATVGAILLGVPIATYTACYCSYNDNGVIRETRAGFTIRFINKVLMSTPSIIVGVLAYQLVVVPLKIPGAGYAGALALALLAYPIIASPLEEALRILPKELRESALALGAFRAHVILSIEYRVVMRSFVTAVILAIARISGETASLLFPAFGNPSMVFDPREPMASMGPRIYELAGRPNDADQATAWAGILILVLMVVAMNLIVRLTEPQTQKV